MKIERIVIKGFLGIDHLDLAIGKPLILIAGGNAVGKTSIAHGIRFVLAQDLCRVGLKKDIKLLVRDGHKLGSVELTVDGATYQRSAATGHITSKDQPPQPHPALQYLLDAPAFVEMEPNARLSFLYYLMGVNRSAASITKLLEERGHAPANIKRIQTHLSGGFAAAHAETMGLAREAKGRWREITGENYGEVKAAAWSSETPDVNPDDITRLTAAIQNYDRDLGQLQARLGALTERQAERARLAQSMRETRRIAGELEARTATVLACRRNVDDITEEERQIREALEKAQSSLTVETHVVQGAFFRCPVCGAGLNYSRGECKAGEPKAVNVSREIAVAEEQVTELKLALTNLKNRKGIVDRQIVDGLSAVGQSEAAVRALADLQEAHEESDTQGAAEVEKQIAAMTAERTDAQSALGQLEAAASSHHEAVSNTKRARAIHEEIKALTALAADLAPDGLPGELLAKAMRPINERLRDSAVMAGWSSVSITTNGILIHSRPWALASGSERWRANAMLAEAIAHLSGIKCFVLDSLDILEPQVRAQALGWLCEVAKDHETIICMATLKQPPQHLPDTVLSVWLE